MCLGNFTFTPSSPGPSCVRGHPILRFLVMSTVSCVLVLTISFITACVPISGTTQVGPTSTLQSRWSGLGFAASQRVTPVCRMSSLSFLLHTVYQSMIGSIFNVFEGAFRDPIRLSCLGSPVFYQYATSRLFGCPYRVLQVLRSRFVDSFASDFFQDRCPFFNCVSCFSLGMFLDNLSNFLFGRVTRVIK